MIFPLSSSCFIPCYPRNPWSDIGLPVCACLPFRKQDESRIFKGVCQPPREIFFANSCRRLLRKILHRLNRQKKAVAAKFGWICRKVAVHGDAKYTCLREHKIGGRDRLGSRQRSRCARRGQRRRSRQRYPESAIVVLRLRPDLRRFPSSSRSSSRSLSFPTLSQRQTS
jgi:hypothetical protein